MRNLFPPVGMLHCCWAMCLLLSISFNLSAQKVTRWPGGKRNEVATKEFATEVRGNIFEEYAWTSPDVKSTEVFFTDGQSNIAYGGATIKVAKERLNITLTFADGKSVTAARQQSKNYYYDLSKLKYVPVVQHRWVSRTTYRSQSVAVTKTRPVTRYVYENGKSRAVYSTETYTAYEHRTVPVTTRSWEPYTTYVLEIPVYDVYIFNLADGERLVIYELGKGDETRYYFQRTSFLLAKDDKTNYVILDANGNGSYFDNEDKIMFNTWNPYSKASQYRSSGIYKENRWVSLAFLRNNLFITVTATENGNIKLENENTKYLGAKGTGKVTFANLPEKGILVINGQKFKIKKPSMVLKTEYGKFKAEIHRAGYLDYEVVYEINGENSTPTLNYEPTNDAVNLSIENIFTPNYLVVVKGENGYEKNYTGISSFSVPVGKLEISIEQDGYVLEMPFQSEIGKPIMIDYEAEVKKAIPEEPSKEGQPAEPVYEPAPDETPPKD
ncbi:hypothetical protein BH09BAC1_BH09BAC1_13840 [soil metagenome]